MRININIYIYIYKPGNEMGRVCAGGGKAEESLTKKKIIKMEY